MTLSASAQVTLPQGYRLEVYASVPGARHLCKAPDGTVFVGTLSDKVYAVTPQRKVVEVASGLRSPNGVAFSGGDLYIAEIHRLSRLRQILSRLSHPPAPEVLNAQLPSETWHGNRVLRFGPDGRLYISLGSPGNAEIHSDPLGTLARFRSDFSGLEVVARGVRNSMGFDWNPVDGKLWFTDNGRDYLGDDLPPEELNRLDRPGSHFGHPYRYGNNVPDPDQGQRAPEGLRFTPPVATMAAHVAPLGMRFYRGSMFPSECRGAVFIANHGSWNRSHKSGYQVLWGRPQGSTPLQLRPFARGWLNAESQVSGRPVDVEELPDGSLLISDDEGGRIYRVSYQP